MALLEQKATIICKVINSVLIFPGNVIDVSSGKWVSEMSGIGAGIDSLYEYLLKV